MLKDQQFVHRAKHFIFMKKVPVQEDRPFLRRHHLHLHLYHHRQQLKQSVPQMLRINILDLMMMEDMFIRLLNNLFIIQGHGRCLRLLHQPIQFDMIILIITDHYLIWNHH